MRLYDVPAPAKLNLFLHVVGRRDDGYHLLQTVFRFIDLNDTFAFERREDGQLVREGDEGDYPPDVPAHNDLVLRAGRRLQQATGTRYGAQIRYTKHIPTGGGLGGGSSDAATTLIALNRLWGTGLTRAALMRLALPLGADVPAFVFGQSAFAQGVGEDLTAIDLPERAYVVVQPPQHICTAEIFSAPDLTRDTASVKISVFADWQTGQRGLFGHNDLADVVYQRYPGVARAAQMLTESGLAARLTGSGSCLFAELGNISEARVHQQKIIGKIPCCDNGRADIKAVWACAGLHEHPLRYWID
ncbi:4-(cytidine 5'-diphospho)-2-C-methyl-D-erythritol kinase [Alcaligenaceae bacterium CGII-47]|nr:4-(cytidine 5'-diphospho)-2-C-methyl-D-erythritol kinase [Alcaligenaceae bacterium CGII-47]